MRNPEPSQDRARFLLTLWVILLAILFGTARTAGRGDLPEGATYSTRHDRRLQSENR